MFILLRINIKTNDRLNIFYLVKINTVKYFPFFFYLIPNIIFSFYKGE